MNLIVNVDRNWGIGKDGDQPFHIPEDLRFFRDKTLGGAVILGRKTLGTFPGRKPLPGRTNIVLSRSMPASDGAGLTVCASIHEAAKAVSGFAPDSVFVIGGEQIYRQMLSLCDNAYVTRVDADAQADCFMPNLDEAPDWEPAEELQSGEDAGLRYVIRRYRRTNPGRANEDSQ